MRVVEQELVFFFFLKMPKLNYMFKSRTILDRRWSAFLRV